MKEDSERVLFVDDADIRDVQGLDRVIHPARKHDENPVVRPEHPWERELLLGGTVRKEGDLYRMWYQSHMPIPIARTYVNLYAESQDGVHWTKPVLGRYEDFDGSLNNNIFFSILKINHFM